MPKGRVLRKQIEGSSSTGVVGQVGVAGCPGVGRSGTLSHRSPGEPSRHCPFTGGCWESHLAKTNPSQSMDARDPRVVPVGWPVSSTKPMPSKGFLKCLPQSPIACREEENLIARVQRCPPRRGIKPRSRARAASKTGEFVKRRECDPTLLDDFAQDLEADVTNEDTPRDSSLWSVIPARSQAGSAAAVPCQSTRHILQWKICCPCR